MNLKRLLLACIFIAAVNAPVLSAADDPLALTRRDNELIIRIGSQDVARYVFRDGVITRPYFADVRTTGGLQVTRTHPPRPGIDKTDHDTLHPGIWLAFGDISGNDYWRLKAPVEHVRFVSEPALESGAGTFAVRNRYRSADRTTTVCEETCSYRITLLDGGYMIAMTSDFTSPSEFVFGDQEEMGLGIRVHTPLAVDSKQGGRILNREGLRNGSGVWGKTTAWCDYAGPLENRWVGMTVLAGPENFRPCWSHARDYGFIAMNPFGRKAFTKGEVSRVVVNPGETFRLRYAVVVHESADEDGYSPAAAYESFSKIAAPQNTAR